MNNICFLQLNRLKNSKNNIKRGLATYFLNNLSRIHLSTIDSIASETNTSYATVCRFFHEIGLSGFKEFKKIIAEELNEAKKNDSVFSEDFLSFTESDSLSTISKRIYDFTVDVLYNGYKATLPLEARKILNCFNNANHIHFFGLGTSSISAQYAYIKFFRLKSGCSYNSDIIISKMTASLLKKDDILFLFSSSGRTKPVIEAARLAKSQGATVITISDFFNSQLYNISDINICTTIRDINKFLDSDFPLIQGQTIIIDILHKYIFTQNQRIAKSNFDKTVSAIKLDKS